MESVHADPLIGRMLDRRYDVRSRIAHGGMATVYLATDTRLDREVALKVMHAELARDADFVSRFIGEAKSVAKLSHPNIVGVYDQAADGQYLYLAMEYVPGWTLRALLEERGWLPWQEALSVMDPVLAGLAAAHQAGIVHRDVKPENVLITADGRVKVADFGLARASAAVGNTRTGQIIGSPSYIAPEQVTGAPSDARTDVYSAGIMLFEMLTGQKPFTGESPLAIAYAHVNSDVPAPAALAGGIPPSVDQLVRAATSRDPRLRPPDAGVFLRVTRALRGMPEPAEPVGAAWTLAAAGAGPQAGAGAGVLADPVDGGAPGSGSHTMVVSADEYPGYAEYAGQDGSGGTGRGAADAHGRAGGHYGGREPFLQRWLFSRRLVYVAVSVLVLLGLCGGAWWLTSGRYKAVPAVAGMTASAATQTLRAAGFQVRTGSSVIDGNVPKGEVISVSPSGRALPGATITLTLSNGPRTVTVPQIPASDTVAQATALLRAHGLAIQETGQVDSSQPQGTVVSQSPAAGASVPAGQTVKVTVSNGDIQIPAVQDQGCYQAYQTLTSDGFSVQVQQGFFFKDRVTGTTPAAGQEAPAKSSVTLQCGYGGSNGGGGGGN